MKKIIPIKLHSPEWYSFRNNGIGGSEAGAVMYLNPYKSATQVFYEKVGLSEPWMEQRESAFHGTNLEEYIANLWKYWDGDRDRMMENFSAGLVRRTCRKVNGYIVNPKYPWLFASIDRLAKKNCFIFDGENIMPNTREFPVECKTISYHAARVWENEIPPSYVIQIHTYMLLMEVDYCEMASLRDGNKFDVVPFKRNNEIIDSIVRVTKPFWDAVVRGRELVAAANMAKARNSSYEYEQAMAELHSIEPEPDTTKAYEEFMASQYVKEKESIQGGDAEYSLCRTDDLIKSHINYLEDERQYIRNQIIKVLVENSCEKIDFGDLGKAVFMTKKNAKNPMLLCQLKNKPDQQKLDRLQMEFERVVYNADIDSL